MARNTVTVGNFTGTWKSRRSNTAGACLWNITETETRCGATRRRGDVLARPARWATRCPLCSSPAYCPDCGDTAATGHRDDCRFDGQR
jgi:hypothetical protein